MPHAALCPIAFISVLLLVFQSAYAAGAGEVDVLTPGDPLVDGPLQHVRMERRELDTSRPYVLGHRGDAGEFPEHGAASYLTAINNGADFIECDVILTKDLKPVCRHEPNLSNTTNADVVFPNMIRTYVIDGNESTGVHAIDLTLQQGSELNVHGVIGSWFGW
eukprot:gene22225-29290_t